MTRAAAVMTCGVLCLLGVRSVPAQDVHSDSEYVDFDWVVADTAYFGARLFVAQRTSGGNPGAYRYMRHELPAPPGPQDLTYVEGAHVNRFLVDVPLSVESLDFEEDVRLLSVPWVDAFIRSYPLIRQDDRLFRASRYIEARGDTNWVNGRITGLTAEDFTALDGSGDHPDFDGGSFLYFGFWRASSRLTTLPPIPAGQVLVYEHASDNFRVTVHDYVEPPRNRPPVTVSDEFFYLDFITNASRGFPVLQNDSDPDGDSIRIQSVSNPFFGEVVAFDDSSVTYRTTENVRSDQQELLTYEVTDGDLITPGFLTIHFCYCPLACLVEFLGSGVDAAPGGKNAPQAAPAAADDSLDVDLFRRFRDEVLLRSERGNSLVEAYYRLAPEVIPTLILSRPDLGLQALRSLRTMQASVRDMLAGNDAVITQELVDELEAFSGSLLEVASDTLRAFIQGEMERIGPLQDFVGMPVADVLTEVVGVSIEPPNREAPRSTGAELRQNYPNPFGDRTTIEYYLPAPGPVEVVVYDMAGRRVLVLDGGLQTAGAHSIVWNGHDASGRLLADGVYLYEIRTGRTKEVRKMVLVR